MCSNDELISSSAGLNDIPDTPTLLHSSSFIFLTSSSLINGFLAGSFQQKFYSIKNKKRNNEIMIIIFFTID